MIRGHKTNENIDCLGAEVDPHHYTRQAAGVTP